MILGVEKDAKLLWKNSDVDATARLLFNTQKMIFDRVVTADTDVRLQAGCCLGRLGVKLILDGDLRCRRGCQVAIGELLRERQLLDCSSIPRR